MQPFRYIRPTQVQDALELMSEEQDAAFIAGGTALVNQLRSGERRATHLVDITDLPLTGLEVTGQGVAAGLRG